MITSETSMVPTSVGEPYFLVADACTIAGCSTRQYYYWIEKGWLPKTSGVEGAYRLTQSETQTLKEFAALMTRPLGELARELLDARQQLARRATRRGKTKESDDDAAADTVPGA